MDILLFAYNIILLLLYGITMMYCITVYQMKKYPYTLYLGVLFLFYIFDNTIIYMTEFLDTFAHKYNTTFMTVPAFKTVIVIVTSFCMLSANHRLIKKALSLTDYVVLFTLALWDLFIPLLPDNAAKVWFYYLPYQLYTLYLSLVSLYHLKKKPQKKEDIPFLQRYQKLLYATLLFSFLIVMEDSVVIFHFDIYQSLTVKINNRSVTEDILSILWAVFFIRHLSSEFWTAPLAQPQSSTLEQSTELSIAPSAEPSAEYEPVISEAYVHESPVVHEETHSTRDPFYLFCRNYNLTTREQDILSCLLEEKHTQDISDLLYISVGTVKTHTHNIYQKLNVTKRHQLIECYQRWEQAAVADPVS